MSGNHVFTSFAFRLRYTRTVTGERSWVQKRFLSQEVPKKSFKQEIWTKLSEKFAILGEILTKQCNFYASQRVRRMSQIWYLYTKLYNERSFQCFVSKMVKELRFSKNKPIGMLLGASLFCWEKEKITPEEMYKYVDEFDRLEQKNDFSKSLNLCQSFTNEVVHEEEWESVIARENLYLWRKAKPGTRLYEYKVLGSFYDVSPRAFFQVQKDTEYRKKWDKLVIKLDVIDKEGTDNGNEVIHWVMHYPYPMYSREYVYIRQAIIDQANNVMILVSRSTDHPACPKSNKFVRVTNYNSRMIIKPHRGFDENGFDYLLTYFDDPQAAFPSPAYNWMASSGVPDFVEKLHAAAKELHRHSWSHSLVPQSPNTCTSSGMQYVYA